MLTLVTWLRLCLSGLSTVKSLPARFHTVLFGRKSLRSRELFSTSLRAEYLQKLLGILHHERFVSFSSYSIICLPIQSFVYISMDSLILILYCGLLLSPTLFILLLKLFHLWPLGALSIDSFAHLFLFFIFIFLASPHTACGSLWDLSSPTRDRTWALSNESVEC